MVSSRMFNCFKNSNESPAGEMSGKNPKNQRWTGPSNW